MVNPISLKIKETTINMSSNEPRFSDPIENKIVTYELLNMLKAGSPTAFKVVYMHYYKPLENFLYVLLRDRIEAEDMTQTVFAKIWEGRDKIDPSRNFKTYLYVIARNTVMNFFKHKKVVNQFHDHASFQNNYESSQDEILFAKETELLIQLTVERMPKMRRYIYELSVNEGLSNDQIAEKLGINKANVANHLSHAKKVIREILAISFIFFHS